MYDPSALTEDLGDDPIKASDYGIKNLKYILPNAVSYTHLDVYKRQLFFRIESEQNANEF